jgi:cytolysin-activating lysine-acyltransferase
MALGTLFATTMGAGSPVGRAIERVAIRLPLNEADELRIMSGVLFLCRYSSLHARYPVETLNRRIIPSLPLEQFQYYTDPHGVPVAFCNWAWLKASVLNDVLATGRDLQADEFQCGDLPFFYEFLAPCGGCRAVVRNLRCLSCFTGRRIPAIRGGTCDGTLSVPRVKYFQF